MTVEIVDKPAEEGILARDLKNGQIAVVLRHRANDHAGRIVQRCRTDLFILGYGDKWTEQFFRHDDFRVQVLPNGTLLRITDNE